MLQDTVFSEGEGDAYFERNRETYEPAHDPLLGCIAAQSIMPRDVLEVGASRGDRLAELHSRYQANVTAIDPSQAAVANGQQAFPFIHFFVAAARALPLEDEHYDLVIASFVFHWIDRKCLLTSAAEIDRVLKPGGYLLLADFAPFSPKKVRYHHRPDLDVYTYKQDYSAIFLATAGYIILAQQIFDHRSSEPALDTPERERWSTTLLKKVTDGIYTADSGCSRA
jgi:ubiquinone/menaquinone biosynthesis C-methylase UbiE